MSIYHSKVSNRSDMHFVDDHFYHELKDFFDHTLKLTVPDTNDVFIEHLKRTYSGEDVVVSDELYRSDIKKLQAYLDVPGSYDRIQNLLNSLKLLYVKKPGEAVSHLDSCDNAQPYRPFSEEGVFIEGYLSGVPNVPYVVDMTKYQTNSQILKYFKTRSSLARDFRQSEYRNTAKYGYVYDLGSYCGNLTFYKADDVITYIESNPSKPDSRTKSAFLMTLALYYKENLSGDSNVCDTGESVHSDSKILKKLKRSCWIYNSKGIPTAPDRIGYEQIDHALYPGLTKDSVLVEMLGIKVSPAEKILKQIDDFSDSAKREVLDSLLHQVLGMQLSSLERNPQLKSIDFPENGISNQDRLRAKIRERFLHARKVEYRIVSRSERVSANVNDDRAFVYSVYKNLQEDCCVCQMCGKRSRHLEITQLLANPEYEIPELNLGLCPDCHHEYIMERNKNGFDGELKNAIQKWKIEDEPILNFRNINVRFTQNHLYQVKLFFENIFPELKSKPTQVVEKAPIVSSVEKKVDAALIVASGQNRELPDSITGTIKEIYSKLNFLPFYIKPVFSNVPYVVKVTRIERTGNIMMAYGVKKQNGNKLPWNHGVDNGSFVWRNKK